MRYSNFVSVGYKDFNEFEVEGFSEAFFNALKGFAPIFEFNEFSEIEEANKEKPHAADTLKISFVPKNKILLGKQVKRNINGDKIISFEGFDFKLTKNTGYLEIGNVRSKDYKRDYDNAPQYQYECYLHINGMMIFKGKRSSVWIDVPYIFAYGTEIVDIVEVMRKAIRVLFGKILDGVY